MKSKEMRYRALVKKRKGYTFQEGLKNPSDTKYDVNEIEPWAQWHNDLDADILLIGQEFCDLTTYHKCQGKVEVGKGYEYPSNKNLAELFSSIGIETGHPNAPNKDAKLFFTNCVMGLKNGAMSANFKDKWMTESRKEFLQPLIEIIEPKAIICIGSKATQSIAKLYGFKFESMKYHAENPPIEVDGKRLFFVFHTGGLGLANRKKELQQQDWKRIGEYLKIDTK